MITYKIWKLQNMSEKEEKYKKLFVLIKCTSCKNSVYVYWTIK